MAQDTEALLQTRRLGVAAPGALERAAEVLERDGLVILPTDTVYGVCAHGFRQDAVLRLYRAKGRPAGQAIPLLLAGVSDLAQVCAEVPPAAWRLAARFWPGALTLVLPRSPTVPDAVTAGGPTVAVRVPDSLPVRELCRRLGAPLAATSANRHGEPDPVTADQAWAALAGRVELLIDGGACPGGMASTVLDLTVDPPRILRAGPIPLHALNLLLRGP